MTKFQKSIVIAICVLVILLDWVYAGTLEDIKACKPLVKDHCTWPNDQLFDTPDDPLLAEQVRVMGSVAWHGHLGTVQRLKNALAVAKKVSDTGRPVKLCVALNPYHHSYLPSCRSGCDPTLSSYDELRLLSDRLKLLKAELTASAYKPKVVFLTDVEKFSVNGHPEWEAAITEKLNLVDVVIAAVFEQPDIEWYSMGIREQAAATTDGPEWGVEGWSLSGKKLATLGCRLYRLPDWHAMRETIHRSAVPAKERNVPMTAWVGLGFGDVPLPGNWWGVNQAWDYGMGFSSQAGAEMNTKWFGDRPDRFAPWNEVKRIIFYPWPNVDHLIEYSKAVK